MTYNDIIEYILKNEGGYVNNPADKGGETNYGITIATARENGYYGKMKDLPLKTAKNIYYNKYWLANRCEEMPIKLAFHFFDACINHGAGNAKRMLQRALGVADDGIIGPITMRAIFTQEIYITICKFNAERLNLYSKLSNFNTFGKGWVNRIVNNLNYV